MELAAQTSGQEIEEQAVHDAQTEQDTRALLPFERESYEVLVRKKAATDAKFGCKPGDRPPEELLRYGIINVDKSSGPTSHQVSAYVQKILQIKKSGHSGTLDPKVTGVLPVALGEGTKAVQALLTAGKEYVCIMHIHKLLPEEEVRKVCASFVGKIKQLPPIKSAVKRQWRYRKVYYFNILEINEQDVLFRIGCQAGTYIRKICHDIGQSLGCGAHMADLRRTKVATFSEDTLFTLHDLADAFSYYKQGNDAFLHKIIQPIERSVDHLKKVWIFDTTVDTLCHGASLKAPGISMVHNHIQVDDLVAIMTLKDELVAIGHTMMTSHDMLKQERGIAVKLERVFMKPGVYPKVEVFPKAIPGEK